jgi:hypothetical protein
MDFLKKEIHNKSLEIKKKIKELNNILANLYNVEKSNNNKNMHLIRKSAEKIEEASKKIESLDFNFNLGKLENDESIIGVHKDTLKNINILKDFYTKKLRKKMLDSNSNEVIKIKQNIDFLNLAYSDLMRLDNEISRNKEL